MDQATEKKEYIRDGGTSVVSVTVVRQRRGYLIVKRLFDIVFSLVLSLALIIPMLVIATMIVIKDPGNPFYIHRRIGKDGRAISVLKFRSMRMRADNLARMLTPEQLAEYKQEFKLKDDPRLLGYKKPGDGERCFGALLRKSFLDELPQIPYNVLVKGNMSFVGPRPIMREELDKFYTPEEQELFLSVKPGITGYWQTNGCSDCTYESGVRQKLELYYAEHHGIGMDFKILLTTVGVAVRLNGHVLCSVVHEQWTGNGRCYLAVKRAFDITASILALVILSPLLVVLAAMVRMDSQGPVIYKRWCVCRDGSFAMLKFRTMVADADDREKYFTSDQLEEYKTNIKLRDDPRVTRVGRFLRRTSMDELPQLINVFRGEMSIVGPRPVVAEELALYGDRAEEILAVRPGITGYWQTHGRSNCTYRSGERQKLELYYSEHRGIVLDVKILLKTGAAVVRRGEGY